MKISDIYTIQMLFLGLVFVGAILNFMVISANGGMPYIDNTEYGNPLIRENGYIPFEDDNEITYPKLADRFSLEILDKYVLVYSIGDVICLIGLIGFGILGIKISKRFEDLEK